MSAEVRPPAQEMPAAGEDGRPLLRDPLLWLTLAATIFAVAPFLQPGYFWGANDARHHIYFLFEYNRLVEDGIWWPRWSPDFAFGYGYPFFNIYGPLSHFLAELLLAFLNFSHTAAVKTVFAFSIVASAAAMYAFVRSWLGRQAAVASALVYVYIPYHLLNLYVRANLAESMALVWLPLCLWTLRQAVLAPSFGWVVGLALSFAGLMLTSNLIIVLFAPLLGLYGIVLVLTHTAVDSRPGGGYSWRSWLGACLRRALPPAAGVAAGIGLSAVFWLPMVLERGSVRVDQWFDGRYDYHGHFVYFYQLFSPRWGFGTSVVGPDDPIGFQIGSVPLLLAVLGLLLTWHTLGRLRPEVICFTVAAGGAIFLGLQWGSRLWDLPLVGVLLRVAQFPWRWFSIASLCISLLAGLILHPTLTGRGRDLDLPLLSVIAVILLSSYPLIGVEIVPPAEGPVSLAGLMRFQRTSDEMTGSTAWVKEIPTWSPMAQHYLMQEAAGGPIEPVDSKLDYGLFDYKTLAAESVAHSTVMEEIYFYNGRGPQTRIVFNHFYYPGWRAYLLDGKHGRPVRELPILPEGCLPPAEAARPPAAGSPCPSLAEWPADEMAALQQEAAGDPSTLGRMTVPLPEGEGYLLLRYEETVPRRVGRFISLATLVLLASAGVFLLVRQHRGPIGTLAH